MLQQKKNIIEGLHDERGEWATNQESLHSMAQEFYEKLYSKDPHVLQASKWTIEFPTLNDWELWQIQREITDVEIKEAAFDMDGFKALGPDGL